MEIVESTYTTLRALGKVEAWLEQWILEKPSRLGLGEIKVQKSQRIHFRNEGGRLDILAYRADLDTYYEIEIMLGECDSDHGFRTLDYWARERLIRPNSRHYAVIVAEDLSGRYKTVIETLPQYLPFIGIEIRALRLSREGGVATLYTTIVVQPDELIIDQGDEPEIGGPEDKVLRDRTWWENNSNAMFLATADEISKYSMERIGPCRVDYSAKSCISLKKGRRCWLPMWPRSDGAFIYFPGGSGGTADSPSDFYIRVKARLEEATMDSPGWSYKYNGGANPISFPIPRDKAGHSLVREILTEAYQLA